MNEVQNVNHDKKKKNLSVLVLTIIFITTIIACITLLPFIFSLKEESNRIAFENYISGLGFWGILLVLLLCSIFCFVI